MDDMLIKVTKIAMGYTESASRCDECSHSSLEDGVLDRSWNLVCQFSNLCHFTVKSHGYCNKFERKK